MSLVVKNDRWVVGPDQFATRITIPDLPGFFGQLGRLPEFPKQRSLVIEPGTRAFVVDDGLVAGEFRGGSYTLESFIERLQFWENRQVTVFLTREEDVPLEMQVRDVVCVDSVCFDIDYRWTIQIRAISRFLDNLMGARSNLSISELSELLSPIANQSVQTIVGRMEYDAVKSVGFLSLLSEEMRVQLETRLTRYGIAFTDLQYVTASSEADSLHERRGEHWLRARELQMQRAVSTLEDDELHTKLQDIKNKVPIRQQLREAVNSDHLNKYQSREDFARGLLEIDKQQVLRKEERDELLETFVARKEDRQQQREHILSAMEMYREQELEELRVETDFAVRQKALRKEMDLAAISNTEEAQQWRHQLQKEEEQANHRRQQKLESLRAACERSRELRVQTRDENWESILHEQKMEAIRVELEVAKAERESRVALIQLNLQSRLSAEKLEIEKRQKAWDLEHKQKRSENQLERLQKLQDMNARFAERQQRMQLEIENLKAEAAGQRELDRIKAMSSLSTEALVALSGTANAALLADLKKHEATQDAVKVQATASPTAELNEERLKMLEKMNATERAKADAIADAYKMAMLAMQGSVQQMIGGLAQAATPAPTQPISYSTPAAFAATPPLMPAADAWYVSLNGQQSSALQLGQVQQYIRSGQVTRDSMVWKSGMSSWITAGQAPELAHLFPPTAPPAMPGMHTAGGPTPSP